MTNNLIKREIIVKHYKAGNNQDNFITIGWKKIDKQNDEIRGDFIELMDSEIEELIKILKKIKK